MMTWLRVSGLQNMAVYQSGNYRIFSDQRFRSVKLFDGDEFVASFSRVGDAKAHAERRAAGMSA